MNDDNDEYLAEHKPENQKRINGVIVNPNLRSGFDDTANEERDCEEWDDWYGVFYIVENRNNWQIRCLDGGAWDRSTMKGSYSSLELALASLE